MPSTVAIASTIILALIGWVVLFYPAYREVGISRVESARAAGG